jgi:flagellar protein FlaG
MEAHDMSTIIPSSVSQNSKAGSAGEMAGARQVTSAVGNNAPIDIAVSQASPSFTPEEVVAAVAEFSSQVGMVATSLAISIDDELGSTIIKVTDRETDEVIRQIPPERIVNLARFMRESSSEGGFELAETMKGLLLESKG